MTASPYEDFVPFDQRIDPDAFELANFTSILAHPDIAAETANEHNAYVTLSAMADLGHVALIRGSTAAYQEWSGYAARYAAQAGTVGSLHAPLTRLHFQGAVHGDDSAANQLREAIGEGQSAPITARLYPVLEACQVEGIYPGFWIDQYATTEEERAELWLGFLHPADGLIRRAKPVPKDELLIGIARTRQVFLEGNLSTDTTVDWAQTAWEFAQSTEEKQRVLALVQAIIPAVRAETTPDEEEGWLTIVDFAAKVIADPDIAPQAKATLEAAVSAHLPTWDDPDRIESRASFEFSCLIRDGATPEQIQERIAIIRQAASEEEMRLAAEGTPYDDTEEPVPGEPLMVDRETLLAAAAQHYIDQRQYNHAATLIAGIDAFYNWQKAIAAYIAGGGDIALLRSFEQANLLLESVKAETDLESRPDATLRTAELDYLEIMTSPTPDYQRAFSVLLVQIQNAPVYDATAVQRLDELLTAAPALVDQYSQFSTTAVSEIMSSLLERVFMVHGNAQAGAEAWYRLQSGRHSAAHYFTGFADLALTAAGVMGRYF